MPKDPRKNIESFQIEGGDLNEFEYQKNQGEMTKESETSFIDGANTHNPDKRGVDAIKGDPDNKLDRR